MIPMRTTSPLAIPLLLAALASHAAVASVVVDALSPGAMGHAAGVEEGWALDAWQQLDAQGNVVDEGTLAHPFDFERVQTEIAPRGPVRLLGKGRSIELEWEEWGIDVRPSAPADAAKDPLDRAWWLAEVARETDDAAAADSLFALAIETATTDVARAQLFLERGDAARDRSDFDAARAHYEAALLLDGERAPEGLAVARDLSRLGALAGRLQSIEPAKDHYERVLEILRTEARPGSRLAEALGAYGFVQLIAGDMAQSEALLTEAATLSDATGLQGRVAKLILNNQGSLFRSRGQYAPAVESFDRLIEMCDATGERGRILGHALFNRAVALRRLGRLDEAERSLMRSLEVRREMADVSLDVAAATEFLGTILGARGDREGAIARYREAIAIFEELAPDGYSLGIALINLGASLAYLERFDETEEHYVRGVDILERAAPGSYGHLAALRNLSQLFRNQERYDEAAPLTEQVLAQTRKMAPGSLDVANLIDILGHDAYREEDYPRARELFDEAWELRARVAPGGSQTASSAHWAGRVRYEQGDLADATRCFCAAVDVLDRQRTQYGGTEDQNVSFAERYHYHAARCLEGLATLGDVDQAFTVLERTRARFLLSLFADREGLLDGELPESIVERRREHRRAVDTALAELARVGASSSERADELRAQLADLEKERQAIVAAVRLEAPRLDALEAFDTLDAEEIVATLDPGTAYVSYWLGPDVTTVFVVSAATAPRGVEAITFEVTEDTIEEAVTRLREKIAESAPRFEIEALASELYVMLVEPWEDRLEGAERLLISPDGPLRVLPFAALRDGDGRFLVERLPLHVVDSATLYARLIEGRDDFDAASARIVAFGDPVYDARTEELDAPIFALRERGFDLAPLPGTRREVAVLDSLFTTSVEVYVGSEATEERVKSLGSDIDILHFACHAVADREIPSASALVLTQPAVPSLGDDNGLLQAWEILEDLRIDAELVTLSACETAIGKELGSEGIAGLTRAFLYAGARSIVASLWSVPDQPTAELMRVFYANLARGVPKDESLRRAQLAMLRGGSAAPGSPGRALGGLAPSEGATVPDPGFAWASMQLVGDWR